MSDSSTPLSGSTRGKKARSNTSAAAEAKTKKSYHSMIVPTELDRSSVRSARRPGVVGVCVAITPTSLRARPGRRTRRDRSVSIRGNPWPLRQLPLPSSAGPVEARAYFSSNVRAPIRREHTARDDRRRGGRRGGRAGRALAHASAGGRVRVGTGGRRARAVARRADRARHGGPDGHPPQRDALLRPRERRAGGARRAAAGSGRGLGAGGRRPARARARARAHALPRHAPLPRAPRERVPPVGGDARGGRHQRVHRHRRDDLPPDGAHRQRRRARHGDRHPRRLGVRGDARQRRRAPGIVFEEWRTRMGAYRRLVEARDALLLGGSRYAGRPTIGDTAVLRKFDVGAIRRFYRDWYRPELMAVVAVGDFDATDVEGQIERRFGAIPASRDPRPRPRPTVSRPAADRPRVAVLSDPEAAETRAALWFPREPGSVRTVGEYRLTLVEELGRDLLGARLESAADHPGSPLLGAWVSLRPLVRPLEAHVVSGSVVEGRLGEAIAALTAEVARLQRFGVSEGELERAREVLLRRYRESASAGDYSDEIAGALARHFLEGAPVLPSEEHYLLAQRLLPEVRVTDITRFAHALPLGSGAVVVTLPPGPRPAWLTADSLLAAARAGAALAVDARYDSAAVARLMPQKPEPGRVVQRRVIAGVDVFEWTLGNGMRVLLKPTNFDSDEILMRIAGPGGASLAEPGEYASAYMADRVLEATGVGPLGGTRLARLLEETSVGLSPVVTDEWVQLSGSAAPRDAETMFQLAHLYFTAPRADSAAFRRYQDRSRSFARSRAADPDAAFGDTVAATLRPRDPRALAASRA